MNDVDPQRHQRVMSILADAMECPAGEREKFLTESCGEDASLRKEVEHLLRHETQSQGFLDGPLLDHGPEFDEDESVIGKKVGSYLIVDEIGRGGMGSVYLAARSDEEFQREVAIKLIKRGLESDLIRRRFRNERQILANLVHQNIARLYDGGTTNDGRAFLVMEYIDGQPIDAYADAHKLSTIERVKLFLAICDAVQYAHRNHVIHRDLKPTNILVNKEGVPKLLDFGIAKFLSPDQTATKTDGLTSAWRILTPEYASPEQIGGDPGSESSDIYSLGAVLYELLTGHRPNRLKVAAEVTRETEKPSLVIDRIEVRPTIAATGAGETTSLRQKRGHFQPGTSSAVSRKTRELTPASVSETRDGTPEHLRRSLRGDLDNIVLMALRNDPERRYASVEEFSNDLRRHLERKPVHARPDSLGYRGRRFFQRNRPTVIATAVVAILFLMVGLSLNFFTRSTSPPITSIAVLPFVNVGQDQQFDYLADGLTTSLIDSLSGLPNLNVPGHNSVVRYKNQPIDSVVAGRALNVNTVILGRTTTNGDTLFVNVEVIDAASSQPIWNKRYDSRVSDVLILERQIAGEVVQHLGLTITNEARALIAQPSTTNVEAYRFYQRGDHYWNLRTELGLGKAIDHFQAAIDLDPNYALAYCGLANSYGLLGAYRVMKPDEVFPRAKSAALRALELDPNLAEAHTSVALVSWLYDWDWAAADQSFRRAIELRPSYVMAHHWYGLYLAEMGRFDEAIASEKRALERDPLSVFVNADLGRVYFYARRYDESFTQYQKTMEMNPNFDAFYSELGQLYEQRGMFDKYLASSYSSVARAEAHRKLFSERGYQGFWEQTWLEWSKTKPHAWTDYYELARVAARLGKKDEAFEMLDRAFEHRDHYMGQLKVEPSLDSLRTDPRFDELLRRMNLTP